METDHFKKLEDMCDDMSRKLDVVQRDISFLMTAFPNGIVAHAEEHRLSAESTQNFKKLKMSLVEKVLGWAVVGLIGAALIALWKSLKGV